MSRLIDRATIDRIFATADIVEVVSDFITLKRKGINYTACCPFHEEKTPSFVVSPTKSLYKCFGCGKGGNVVSFVMEHEKMSYPEALRHLAKKYGIPIEEYQLSDEQLQVNDDRESMMILNSWASDYFKSQLQAESSIYSYFIERGFTLETIDKFDLGYSPESGNPMSKAAEEAGYKEEFLLKTGLSGESRQGGGLYDRFYGRVIFPIQSLSGRVLGFGGRTLRSDKNIAKYLNSPESEVYHKSQTLYGLFHAKRAITQLDRCILVEGYTDVIQMHQAGVENVVATSGTALTEEQIRLVRRFTKNVTVIYDGDSAGIRASLRGIDMLLKDGLTVRSVMLPEGEDPDSFARNNTSTYLKEFLEQNEVDFITFKTNLLLDDAKDDPIKRAGLINDIISSIAVIPDAIERQVFIRECARLMEVPENILQREVQRKMIGSVDGKQWYESVRKRDIIVEKSEQTASPKDDKTTTLNEIQVLEHELIRYLVKYGDQNFIFEDSVADDIELSVAETIIDEVESFGMEFRAPLYGKIFAIYRDAKEAGTPPSSDLLVNSEESEISAFVTDVQFSDEKYIESSYWERSERQITTEKDRLTVAIPKTLSILLQKIINHKIKLHILELLEVPESKTADSEAESPNQSEDGHIEQETVESRIEELNIEIGRLNGLRIEICEKFERTR